MNAQRNPEVAARPRARRVAHWWPLVSGLIAVALVVALGTLIVVRDQGMPLSLDTRWMTELNENRAPVWRFLARVMDSLGGGPVAIIVLPVVIGVALLLVKRPWAAGYYLAATV